MHYVSSSTVINASQRQVWEFIKPPENSVFLSPDVILVLALRALTV